MKLDKIVNTTKSTFLTNPKILLHYVVFFHEPLNPVFFILSADQSFEVFPRHNGVATISGSFALNF